MAYQGEEVTLDGGIPIDTDWIKYKGDIYKTKINQPIWQLFVGGRSMFSARWPNGNWDDGSVWDKTKSMNWPENRGSKGHYFNENLKELNFTLENGGILIVNAGSFRT